MRVILYIAFATAIWFLGRAVMRHYLSSSSRTKESTKHRSSMQEEVHSPKSNQETSYGTVRDARYRDVE